jgi:hypothetical protein
MPPTRRTPMQRSRRRGYAITVSGLMLLACGVPALRAATVALSSATLAPGSTGTLRLQFQTGGASVSGLQFDVVYDPANVSLSGPAAGPVATAAGKSVSQFSPAAGTLRILIVGFGQETIASGEVLSIQGAVPAGSAPGSYALSLSNLSATDPNGVTVSLTGAGGTITVTAPTTTVLTVSPTPAGLGTSVQVSATVTPAGSTGNVTFKKGATTLGSAGVANGVAALSVNTAGLGLGLMTLTAEYAPSDPRWLASTGTFQLAVLSQQTLTFPAVTNVALDVGSFPVGTTSTAGLPVTHVSSTPAVCSVSGNSVLLVATGTCTITASAAGNGSFVAAVPVTRSFLVVAAPPCSYRLSGDASIPAAAGAGTLEVATGSSCSWSATTGSGFITVLPDASRTGSGNVRFTMSANTSAAARSGIIQAGGQTWTVSQFGTACSIAISPATLDFTSAKGSATVSITGSAAACPWAALSSDIAKLSLSTGAGVAPTQITVTAEANTEVNPRSLTATIGGQTLTATQSGRDCTYALSSSSVLVPAAGGPASVDVTTSAGCGYSTVAGPGWITITSGGTGTGPNGTVYLLVNPNTTTASRSATLSIGAQPFQITQAGVACDLSLDTTGLGSPFAAASGAGAVGVTTSSPGCVWSASNSAAWLTVSPLTTVTGPGTISVSAAANGSANARTAQVSIGGNVIYVTQSGTVCSFALQSENARIPAAGGSASVTVTTAPGCNWSSSTATPWLTIDGAANGGTGDVKFTAAANSQAAARTGTLTVAGQTYTVVQSGVECAFTLSLAGAVLPASGAVGATFSISTTGAGCSAKAVSFSDWLSVSTSFSGQSGTVTYSAAANTSGSPRSGLIQVGGQAFTVSEAGSACSYTLSTGGAVFGTAGGTGSFTAIASGPGCTPPTVSSDSTFVTPGSVSGPVGNVFTVVYAVETFVSGSPSTRIANLTMGGRTFAVKETSW